MNEKILQELKVLNELLSIIAFTLVEKDSAWCDKARNTNLNGAIDLLKSIRERLPNE